MLCAQITQGLPGCCAPLTRCARPAFCCALFAVRAQPVEQYLTREFFGWKSVPHAHRTAARGARAGAGDILRASFSHVTEQNLCAPLRNRIPVPQPAQFPVKCTAARLAFDAAALTRRVSALQYWQRDGGRPRRVVVVSCLPHEQRITWGSAFMLLSSLPLQSPLATHPHSHPPSPPPASHPPPRRCSRRLRVSQAPSPAPPHPACLSR